MGEVIAAVAISPDGQRIVSGGDYHAQLWTLRRGRWDSVPLDAPREEMQGWVYAVAFSPDGRRVATGGADGFVRLWDGTTGKPAGDPLRAKAGVTSVGFSRDGAQLLSGGARGTLELWNLQERRSVAQWLKNQDGAVTALSFSADGRLAVSGGEDGMLRLWNAAPEPTIGEPQAGATLPQPTPDCDRAGNEHPAPLRSRRVIAWSADCTLAAVGRNDTLQLIDVRSGEPLGQPVAGHKTGEVRDANAKEPKINVVSAAFSGDGQYVVSGSENGSVQRWQTSPLRPDGEPLLGHRSGVASVALSPDGRTIASVDGNGQFRLWDRQSGQPFGSPLADTSGIQRVAFSADGTQVVALEEEGTLRSWPAPVSWQDRLCEKLTRDMSPDQWRTWLTPEIAFMKQCNRSADGATERR